MPSPAFTLARQRLAAEDDKPLESLLPTRAELQRQLELSQLQIKLQRELSELQTMESNVRMNDLKREFSVALHANFVEKQSLQEMVKKLQWELDYQKRKLERFYPSRHGLQT